MQMLQEPLSLSIDENRQRLKEMEAKRVDDGRLEPRDEPVERFLNRHERRRLAKLERA